jgi:hypothetical protein
MCGGTQRSAAQTHARDYLCTQRALQTASELGISAIDYKWEIFFAAKLLWEWGNVGDVSMPVVCREAYLHMKATLQMPNFLE